MFIWFLIADVEIQQFSPIFTLPPSNVWATIAVFSFIIILCAIWHKLSIFTLFSIIVLSIVPFTIQVLAPISTKFPIWTPPKWTTLIFLLLISIKPNPSSPIIAPDWIIQLSPITVLFLIVTLFPIIVFLPILTLSSIVQ